MLEFFSFVCCWPWPMLDDSDYFDPSCLFCWPAYSLEDPRSRIGDRPYWHMIVLGNQRELVQVCSAPNS